MKPSCIVPCVVNLLLAAALAGMLAQARAEPACPEYTPGGKLVGEFHTMGSPTMDTITLGWIELFRDAHREIEDVTTMEARPTTTVVTALTRVQIHVGPASRALFLRGNEALVKTF